MFTLSSSNTFHLYSRPTDMRKSFDGLSGIIQNTLECNPLNAICSFLSIKGVIKSNFCIGNGKSKGILHSPLGHLRNHLNDGSLEIDNNIAKNAIRTISYHAILF